MSLELVFLVQRRDRCVYIIGAEQDLEWLVGSS